MTITATQLLNAGSSASQTNYATASFSSTSGRPILFSVENALASPSTVPTLSAHGLTWTQVATIETDGATVRRRITTFRAEPGSNGSGTATIDFGGVAQSNCWWTVHEFTGADTSSGWVVQSITAAGNGFGTVSATLGAAPSTTNAIYGYGAINNTTSTLTAGTAGGGYTDIGQTVDLTTATRTIAEFQTGTTTTTVDMSISGAAARRWDIIGLEILAASVAAGSPGSKLPLVGVG